MKQHIQTKQVSVFPLVQLIFANATIRIDIIIFELAVWFKNNWRIVYR